MLYQFSTLDVCKNKRHLQRSVYLFKNLSCPVVFNSYNNPVRFHKIFYCTTLPEKLRVSRNVKLYARRSHKFKCPSYPFTRKNRNSTFLNNKFIGSVTVGPFFYTFECLCNRNRYVFNIRKVCPSLVGSRSTYCYKNDVAFFHQFHYGCHESKIPVFTCFFNHIP